VSIARHQTQKIGFYRRLVGQGGRLITRARLAPLALGTLSRTAGEGRGKIVIILIIDVCRRRPISQDIAGVGGRLSSRDLDGLR
jgi:hypothetical protein